MAQEETPEERSRRTRNGWLALILSFGWWIISIGGIITVINMQS